MKIRSLRRALSSDRGASLLEFAIVAPVLFALLFGLTTGALAYSAKHSLNGAVREAGRFAATLPVDGDMNTWLNDVADVTLAAATGALDDGVAGRLVCVSYVHPDGTDPDDRTTRLTVDESGLRTVTNAASCLVDGRPDDERRVQVEVTRSGSIQAVLYTQTFTMKSRSIARFERALE